jgi:hypothetical protein
MTSKILHFRHEIRTDMSETETAAYNTALEHVKTAAKTDSITSSNSEDMRLSDSLSSNISQQEQIAAEKAKTQQDIETFTDQKSYTENNSGTINRNLNDAYLQNIINAHPELNGKSQALAWAKTHQSEADAIAQDTIKQNNPFETPEYQSRVANLKAAGEASNNAVIDNPNSLQEKHDQNAANIEKQAVVKGDENEEIYIKDAVKNVANNSNLGYNKSTEELLRNNLNAEEQVIAQNLDNERSKVDGSVSNQVALKIKEGKNTVDSLTGSSTALRVLEKIGDDTNDVLGIEKVNNKKHYNRK